MGDRATRLTLLASAIAGRRIDVALSVPGTPTWTDGQNVYLDPGFVSREQIQAVAVQSCLLRAESLGPAIATTLRRKPQTAERYLLVEGRRALNESRALLPPAALALLVAGDDQPDNREASLAIAEGRSLLDPLPVVFGQIRPHDLRPTRDTSARSDGLEQASTRAREHRELKELLDEEADDDGAQDLSSPVGGGGAIGRLLQRLTSTARSRSTGSPGIDAATHTVRNGRGNARITVLRAAATVDSTTASVALVASPATYPEWDLHRRAYRERWCTVAEGALPLVDGAALPTPHTLSLRRALSRIGLELAATRRQLQGDDIDIDAAVGQRIDVAARSTPDEAVYVDQQRRRRELSVQILLDVSGSTGEPSATGRTVHEEQQMAAAALTFALHQLGDRVSLHAFRSMGRANVEITQVKSFADAADATVLRRLASLRPGAYTRLGAAIRHGTALLERESGTGQRLLVVLSDGFAYDHGYEGRYGEADARRALVEARRSGIGCLCLSVGGVAESEELSRVFGTAAHATLRDAAELSLLARSLFTSALRSADSHRRQWSRADRSRSRQLVDRRSA